MNFSITGQLWRSVLKAVPENTRPEVLGTLIECYGARAPSGEAIRTFISGSRMSNRLNASSPLELWREAARSALVFTAVFGDVLMLGQTLIPDRGSHTTPFWPGLILAAVTVILAAALLRGRLTRTFVGVAVVGQVSWFAFGIHGQLQNHVPGVTPTLSTAVVIYGISCIALFIYRHSFKATVFVMTAATLTTGIAAYFLPRLDGTQLLRSANTYPLFALSQTVASLTLLSLASLAGVPSPRMKANPRWWPFVVSFGFALGLSLSRSSWVPEQWTSPFNRLLGALAISLLALSVLLSMARPHLSLTFAFLCLAVVTRRVFFEPLIYSGLSVLIAPMLVAGAATLLGWQAARRSLRT